jgi:hypothetical protein
VVGMACDPLFPFKPNNHPRGTFSRHLKEGLGEETSFSKDLPGRQIFPPSGAFQQKHPSVHIAAIAPHFEVTF